MQVLRVVLLSLFVAGSIFTAHAENARATEEETTHRVEIVKIVKQEVQEVPNTNTEAVYQTLEAKVIEGALTGKVFVVTEAGFNAKLGDIFYLRYIKTFDGSEYVSLQEPYRIPALLWLAALFVVAVLLLGGKQGFLSLVALCVSFGVIFKVLFPELLSGEYVIFVSVTIALSALFVVMYLTHGFTRLTTSAFLGSAGAVLVTVFLAKYAVMFTALTGYADEESVFLNIATSGRLDFVALLVGGIIIGVIGVIDDVTVTQASVVNELRLANPNLSRVELYAKALKVGRDHVGAVVNTLILAYTGASLPLVLLLYTSTSPAIELINREAIATEVVRSIVGSLGLLIAMPLTTAIAVWLMYANPNKGTHAHHHH